MGLEVLKVCKRLTKIERERLASVGDLAEGQVQKVWREVADERQNREHADLVWLVIQNTLPVREVHHRMELGEKSSMSKGAV